MIRVSNQKREKVLVFLSVLAMLSTLFSFSAFAANTATVSPTAQATVKPSTQATTKPATQTTVKPSTQATTNPGTQVTATAGTQTGSDQTGSTVAPSVNPTGDANATASENPVVSVQPSDDAQAAVTAAADAEKDQSPKTGDGMPLLIGGVVLFVSLAAMVTIVLMRKKANR